MKSFGDLFERVWGPADLHAAMMRAARGKRDRAPVARFLADADAELAALSEEIRSGRYAPRPYTQFRIMDPKPRRISCADFRDRVVHHSLCAAIGPVIEPRLVADTFACRRGKGAHRAVLRAQTLARRFPYFAKLDIERFYDSVDHEVLLGLLGRLFREGRLRELLECIIRHPFPGQTEGKGLPIGNLTSQWFANLYLDGADHQVKDEWQVGGYVRYMDDMLVFARTKAGAWESADALHEWLWGERSLRVKASSLVVAPCSEGIPFLAMRVFPRFVRFQHARYHRARRLVRRREKECAAGTITAGRLIDSAQAVCGCARFFGIRPALGA